MKSSYSDIGIILKSIDFGEADKLVGVLSEYHGYTEYVARGARRMNSRKAPHLDLFNLVRYQVSRGTQPQFLDQAETENFFPNIKKDLEKIKICLSLAEIISSIAPLESEDRPLYLSLKNFLEAIENINSKEESQTLIHNFGLYTLRHLGYQVPTVSKNQDLSGFFESIMNKRIISHDMK